MGLGKYNNNGPLAHFLCVEHFGDAMRQAPDRIVGLIEPIVVALGYQCVGIEYVSQLRKRLLRVYIDREGGILLDDCTRVSHQISAVLDVDDPISGQYELEVSSPGIDRPLFKLEDFERFKEQNISVKISGVLNNRKSFAGRLLGLKGESVLLKVDENSVEIPFPMISKARLVPDFKTSKKRMTK